MNLNHVASLNTTRRQAIVLKPNTVSTVTQHWELKTQITVNYDESKQIKTFFSKVDADMFPLWSLV